MREEAKNRSFPQHTSNFGRLNVNNLTFFHRVSNVTAYNEQAYLPNFIESKRLECHFPDNELQWHGD